MLRIAGRWTAALAAWLVVLGGGRAGERPAAKTPEEAVRLYHDALRAGDLGASLAHVAGPTRAAWEAAVTMVRAVQTFEDALDRQFGKDPAHRRMFDLREEGKAFRAVAVRERVERKGGVDLVVWKTRRGPGGKDLITEVTFRAVEEEAGWRLWLPLPFTATRAARAVRKGPDGKDVEVTVVENLTTPTPGPVELVLELLAAATAVSRGLAEEVAAGKYRTRPEALGAFRERMAQGRAAPRTGEPRR